MSNLGGDGTTSGGGGGDYDYADVLGKSILFYEAQRSGYYRVTILYLLSVFHSLIVDDSFQMVSNNNGDPTQGRVSWRGDSATGDRGKTEWKTDVPRESCLSVFVIALQVREVKTWKVDIMMLETISR